MRRLPSEPVSEMYKRRQFAVQKILERRIFWLVITSYGALLFLLIMFLKTSPLADEFRYRFNGTDCVIQCVDYDYGNGVYFECDGESVLIDSGSSEHSEELLNFIENQGIEKIDYFLLPNPSEEYLKVFADVIESVDIVRVVVSQCDDSLYAKYDDLTFVNVVQLFTADICPYFVAGDLQFDITDAQTMSAQVKFESNLFLLSNLSDENEDKEFAESVYEEKADLLISLNGRLPSESFFETHTVKNIVVSGSEMGGDSDYSAKIHSIDSCGNVIVKSNGVKLKFEYEIE